ncbi:MAG TPA: PEGA domain-containing protein [Thermoanaerobaculia bacterium]|nr:PEGA domain-containing protein [Thermoanaerobaculia bacterium]
MTLQRLAAKRLLEGGAVAVTALLLAGPVLASPDQSRQRPSDSGSGGRTAIPNNPSPSAPPSGGSGVSGDSGRSHDSSPPPRTAQPAPGAGNERPDRQPSHRRGGGGGGGRGGYYYGDGWHRPWYGGWGWWGYGWHGYGYPPYYGPGGYPYYGAYREDVLGALDLDVSPGRAQVYLDGRYLGTVDAYDGFPRYLWLEKGTYDLVLFLDGYRTVARQVSVYPGTVLGINDRLEEGESTPPEQMVTPRSTERRDARIREERERREEIERGDDWRDRVRDERRRRDDDGYDRRGDDDGRDDRGEWGDRGDRGEESRHSNVRLDVEPRDASVYLDGRFVGTGEDLRGLSVNPGRHQLAVVRPGYESKEQEFEVTAGEELVLEVELEEND